MADDILSMDLLLEEDGLVIDLNEGHIDPYVNLEGVEVIAVARTVDAEMSDISTNAVQNKTVKAYVDLKADKHYTHNQITPSKTWEITHNLNKHPTIVVVDSAGSAVIGEINFINLNQLIISFNAGFSGKAYCN